MHHAAMTNAQGPAFVLSTPLSFRRFSCAVSHRYFSRSQQIYRNAVRSQRRQLGRFGCGPVTFRTFHENFRRPSKSSLIEGFPPSRTSTPVATSQSHESAGTQRSSGLFSVLKLFLRRPLSFVTSSPVGLVPLLRAIVFYCWSISVSVPVFLFVCIMYFPSLILDPRRRLLHGSERFWARLSTFPLWKTYVDGKENLLDPDTPVMYVANHQSYLDVFSLFWIDRDMRYVSKGSIFFLPVIGWSMFLCGHISLWRTDRRSQLYCVRKALEFLKQKSSMIFFPEGTRSKTQELLDFKMGAFSIARKAGVPVIPITIFGTGRKIPPGKEAFLAAGDVHLVIHKALDWKSPEGKEVTAEEMKNQVTLLMKKTLLEGKSRGW